MKMGFDLHGVLDTTDWHKNLSDLIKSNKIYIITGPPKTDAIAELTKLKYLKDIHYHEVISVVDFLKESNCEMWKDEKDTWWASEEDWWSSKAKICKENGISIMFDDKEKYQSYFRKIHPDSLFLLISL